MNIIIGLAFNEKVDNWKNKVNKKRAKSILFLAFAVITIEVVKETCVIMSKRKK
ncbi:hypothetical protein O5404_06115 (plasmid) [Borrelia miyamotoi]|uniref:Uncharacterized protein n=1 Tax=Borrelia miyamotoi TaxID=47466 RepID=A0AAX3JPD7_9SPIR|nr:hypothetical protein [Borrelia miyamotoi]WAZ72584.1 hypothetical protein O5404_06115 [Borrelia miyamotoi]